MIAYVTLEEIERSLLHDKPRRRFIIPGVLPAGPCLLYGASGAGKTGIAIRTVLAASAGLQWADRSIEHGAVLYVCGEDIDGAKERLVAAARALGQEPGTLHVAVMPAPEAGIGKTESRHAITGAARELSRQSKLPVVLIVVDTLAACFGEKSQDDASAASEYMNSADRIARDLGCCVLSVHHTGKNEDAGMRGSRVFFDRADAVVKVKRGQDETSFLQVEKLRNGPDGARFAFTIGGDEIQIAGGPISVQVIRDLRALTDNTDSTADARDRRKQTIADQMLAALVRVGGATGASVEAWQTACYDLWSDKKSETKRKLFSKTKNQMQGDGLLTVEGENVTITVTGDAMVTPLVTQEPENVTVTVTNPLSVERGDSARATGPLPKQKGTDLSGKNPKYEEGIGKPTGFPPGCGTGGPTNDPARGDGDADGRLTDAA
ncbi:AAA family ATPase [Corticibacterium sp. UT-5YL-CI-8]|nr:AAA family ATPase [Tianweitania sp. UT-5YL-CI-8]